MTVTHHFIKDMALFCGLVLVGGTASAAPVAADTSRLVLATAAKTSYVITVAADASSPERFAANELAAYLKTVTGAEFAIVPPGTAAGRPQLAVGAGAAQAVAPALSLNGLGLEGVLIQATDGNMVLTGGPGAPRGTLYAVYSFLEDVIGVRWWTPAWTQVPRQTTLAVAVPTVRYVPPFEYREPFFANVLHQPQWAVANKANGHHYDLQNDPKRGGAVGYTPGLQFVHTFAVLVPANQYFGPHPEWFSEKNGKRVGPPGQTQLCLTNPELLRHIIAQAREHLRRSPKETMISISQNDFAAARCECPNCLAVEAEEGSPSGPLLRFVNAVADAVKDEFPQAAVDTIAYQYTRRPPRHVRPRPNVIVRLCSVECSFATPLAAAPNEAFFRDLQDWSKISSRIYIWTYEQNYLHYLLPFPDLYVSAENLRLFARNQVKGVFDQGSYQGPAELQELRAWVSAKLLWNPDQNEQALIEAFAKAYYGPQGSPAILNYIQASHAAVTTTQSPLYINTARQDVPYLPMDTLVAVDAAFDRIPAPTMADPVYGPRIRMVRACGQFAILSRLPELRVAQGRSHLTQWPFSQPPREMLTRFRQACAEAKCTVLSEVGRPVASFSPREFNIEPVTPRAPTLPAICKELPASRWRQVTQERFNLAETGWVEVDLAAESGLAAVTGGEHKDWTFQYDLSSIAAENPNQLWDVYVSLRIQRKGNQGLAFLSGFYDTVRTVDLLPVYQVNVTDTAGDGYHYVKVGRLKFARGAFWWLGPAGNGANVESIRVDRLVLIKAD